MDIKELKNLRKAVEEENRDILQKQDELNRKILNADKKLARARTDASKEHWKHVKELSQIDLKLEQHVSSIKIKNFKKEISEKEKELEHYTEKLKESYVFEKRQQGFKLKDFTLSNFANRKFDKSISAALDKNSEFYNPEKAAKLSEQQFALNTAINVVKGVAKTFGAVLDTFGINLGSLFEDVMTDVADKLKTAVTYSTGTSLITNAEARKQQMRYGLSSAQNYALTQTMGMLGMKDEEDLMYMNSAQKEKFSQFMDTYSSWYNKMESSGVLEDVQEIQLEFAMFKQEISMKFLEWIAKNKDTIMKILDTTMAILEGIFNGLSWLFKGSSSSTSSDIATDSINNSNVSTNNLKVNQTNNITGLLSDGANLNSLLNGQNESMFQSAFNAVKALG